MAERGSYRSTAIGPTAGSDPQPDYGELGAALGIGALIGILIGSNITFHSPVRKRRR